MKELKEIAYIGLGSNIGNRGEILKEAIERLQVYEEIEVIEKSSIKETAPVDNVNQPDFLNQVIKIKTLYSPEELLAESKRIEKEMGRREKNNKGPRIIDLDILLFNDIILETDDLIIPHREIKNRKFIIKHLIEIDPEIRDPHTNLKFSELLNNDKTS